MFGADPDAADGVPTEQPEPDTEKSFATTDARVSDVVRVKASEDAELGESGAIRDTDGAPLSTVTTFAADLEVGPSFVPSDDRATELFLRFN
jgi:hypothetical protein